MVRRPTWVLLAVFIALIGLAVFWTSYQNGVRKSHPTPTSTPQQYLFSIDQAAVASFKITGNVDGKTVMVTRDSNGQWSLVEPKSDYTDVANVEAAITQLASLSVQSSLTNTNNLAEYGLDKPTYIITVNMNGGTQYIAQVGSSTATSSGYYVLIPGGVPQIVSKSSLDAVLKLWLNPPIATPTLTPTSTSVITPTIGVTTTLTTPSIIASPQPSLTNTPIPSSTATITTAPSTPTTQVTDTPVAVTPTVTGTP